MTDTPALPEDHDLNEIIEVVGPAEPKRLDVVLSVRLQPRQMEELQRVAEFRRATTSDLIRAAVDWILDMTGAELDRLLQCNHCAGTGSRITRRPS